MENGKIRVNGPGERGRWRFCQSQDATQRLQQTSHLSQAEPDNFLIERASESGQKIPDWAWNRSKIIAPHDPRAVPGWAWTGLPGPITTSCHATSPTGDLVALPYLLLLPPPSPSPSLLLAHTCPILAIHFACHHGVCQSSLFEG